MVSHVLCLLKAFAIGMHVCVRMHACACIHACMCVRVSVRCINVCVCGQQVKSNLHLQMTLTTSGIGDFLKYKLSSPVLHKNNSKRMFLYNRIVHKIKIKITIV